MIEIVGTEKALMLRAFAAAEVYGTSVDVLKALKLGETVEVDSEIAQKLIADGYAKEAAHGN